VRFAGVLFWGIVTASLVSHVFAQEVTIEQLRTFLLDQHRLRHSDTEIANRLSSAWLSERLTSAAMSGMTAETKPGPEAVEQLRFLADASIFAAPPANEILTSPRPSQEQQRAMLAAGAAYSQTALQHLPDFLALRVTRRFDNRPVALGAKHTKATMQMHWIGEFKNQVTYRQGAEVAEDPDSPQRTSAELAMHPGLVSMGEFGPMLMLVFSDFKQGSVAWTRWETDPVRGRLAVFHYTVPKFASHYLVDFCCYTMPEDEMRELEFRDHPAYHGEIVLSPDSGSVLRITIEADLDTSAPILTSQLAVKYDDVEIGGRSYLCPVRSNAMTALHNSKMERINGVGIERHLNEVQYLDYHKFGSTSRMITNR
jgi:hypothetical protein